MGHQDNKPVTIITVVLAANLLVLAWFGWSSYASYCNSQEMQERHIKAEELLGVIAHLDEVLTMSSRMAAVTGDLNWEKRYRKYEPILNEAIEEAMTLYPEAYQGEAAAVTDAANVKLVEMEHRAFDLIGRGNSDSGVSLLFGEAYEQQKRIYLDGMLGFRTIINETITLEKEREVRTTSMKAAIVLLLSPLLILSWFTLFRAIRQWTKARILYMEHRLESIAETTLDAIVTMDSKGKTTFWNKGAERMFGYDRDEVLGRDCHDFIRPEEFKGQQTQALQAFLATGDGSAIGKTVELKALKKGGDEFPIEMTLSSSRVEGGWNCVAIVRDITERKLAEHEIEQLSAFGRNNPAPLLRTSMDGTINLINPAAKSLFGKDAIGTSIKSILPGIDDLFSSPGLGNLPLQFEQSVGNDIFLFSIKRDESTHSVYVYGSSITERVEQEAEFAQTVSNYLALINTVPAQMYLKDIDHKYIIANKAFCESVGRRLSEVIGTTDYDLFPPDKADLHHLADKTVIENEERVDEQEERIRDQNGKYRWYSTTKVPLHDNQRLVSGLVAITQDVTAKHLSREQLVQADKLAAIGTLAAGVAHEINNPMGFINSNLNTMNKYLSKIERFADSCPHPDSDEADRMKDILTDFGDAISESLDGANRVKKIVADLKSFSRVDRSELETVCINDGLESTLNIVWNELKYKCTVEKNYGDIPDLFCIPNQLNQVFLNLFVNAGHAIDESSGKIVITTWSDESSIMISIKDSGRGIPRDVQGKIFEPFFTTKEVGKGTGLGLSLAYDIVKKHKGNISVKSEVGEGSEFIIRLPLKGLAREHAEAPVG